MSQLTGIAPIDWFLSALDYWGYAIVFGFTIFENLFIVGSFTPGETIVVAAAFMAAQHRLSLSFVFLASVVGTVTGANITYWLGRRAGIETIERMVERLSNTWIGRLFRIRVETVNEVYTHFHTQGAKTVLISRFAAGAKNMVPAIAGATRMPFGWFEIYCFIGALIYTSINCLIGWFLGANLDRALAAARNVGIFGLLIFVAFIVFAVYTSRKLSERAEARRENEAQSLEDEDED